MNFAGAVPHFPKRWQTAWMPCTQKGMVILKNALEWDRKMYMVQDLLEIHDNACMAHGIEGRASAFWIGRW